MTEPIQPTKTFKRIQATIDVSVEIALPDYLDLSDPETFEQMSGCGYPVDSEQDVYAHIVRLLLMGGENCQHDVFGWLREDISWMNADTKYRQLDIEVEHCEITDC